MSQGNLEGKVVDFDFWPACHNCALFDACSVRPHHPAYPHSWHWGKEFAAFADGYLIVRSWVGSSTIGQPHTGCKSYEVNPQHAGAPQIHHRLYLDLEQEKGNLETEMAALESKKTWTRNDEEFHAALFGRFRRIVQKQEALRSAVADTRPQALAVNEQASVPGLGEARFLMEDMIMPDFTITDAMKQAVITRLATINSATSLLSLINGRPAKVTVDEVLTLAGRIEQWAWRDLREDQPPQSPTPKRPDTMALQTRPAAKPLKTNGHGQRQGDATENQINALFAIGKSKGFDRNGVIGWVKERSKKSITALTSREASNLIGDLNAM